MDNEKLKELCGRIMSGHKAYLNTTTEARSKAKEVGDWLLEAKNLFPRGEWEKWLEANSKPCLGMKKRQAQNYMRVARHWDTVERRLTRNFSIEAALDALKVPKEEEEPDSGDPEEELEFNPCKDQEKPEAAPSGVEAVGGKDESRVIVGGGEDGSEPAEENQAQPRPGLQRPERATLTCQAAGVRCYELEAQADLTVEKILEMLGERAAFLDHTAGQVRGEGDVTIGRLTHLWDEFEYSRFAYAEAPGDALGRDRVVTPRKISPKK